MFTFPLPLFSSLLVTEGGKAAIVLDTITLFTEAYKAARGWVVKQLLFFFCFRE